MYRGSLRWLLLTAAPVVFALVAVLLGKEAGWDLQNYHWYNPYALLQQRLGFDIAVAHHSTYFNPLSDVPFYWLATHAPAWLVGAYLGALFGVVVALIGAIAYQALRYQIASPAWRLASAALIALAGAIGGGALPAVGSTSNDVPSAIGSVAALLIVVSNFTAMRTAPLTRQSLIMLLVAGLCAGISTGLKLTTAIYALGLLAAVCFAVPSWRSRTYCVLLLGAGMLLGFLLSAGPWLWRMWHYGGNPLFPYFNDVFHSPLLTEGSYRDTSYVDAHDWRTRIIFPWLFTLDSLRVAEWKFRDAHILAAYVLIPLTLLVCWFKRTKIAAIAPLTMFLFCFAAVTYLVWLFVFSIYRYLIPLEMLAPLLIVLAIMAWPASLKIRIASAVVLLLVLQAMVNVNIARQPWGRSYVNVQLPSLADPQHSMILMAGTAPMAFVIPSFPSTIPFLRVDGWLVWKDDYASGLAQQMRARVAQHNGPLFMLFAPLEQQRAVAAAQAYGLVMSSACEAIRSNISEPLQLCNLQQVSATQP